MTTYATLISTATDFAARTDLTASMPSFITLAEDRIRRDVRTLDQQTRATLVVDNTGMVALPERFLGFRSVTLAEVSGGLDRTIQLDYVSPDKFAEMRTEGNIFTGTQRDSFFSIEGGNFLLYPAPDGAATTSVDVTYWRAYERLDDTTNTTNWLLQNHFDIYFNGVMVQINAFLMDVEAELLWVGKYERAVQNLGVHEGRKQRTGPKIRMARAVT